MDIKIAVGNLLKVFAKCISVKGTEEEEDRSMEKEEDKVTSEGGETDKKNKDSSKENAGMLANITANCNEVLDFLQDIAVNSPQAQINVRVSGSTYGQ